MNLKSFFSAVLAIFLLAGFTAVQASSNTSLPALNPWKIDIIEAVQSASRGQYVSITHHPYTGALYLSYYDQLYQDLKFAYQVPRETGNCGPDLDWNCSIVDSTGNVGMFSSIDITWVKASPPYPPYYMVGISYYDLTNTSLKFAEAVLDPLSSWTIETVQSGSPDHYIFGPHSTLKYDSAGNPHIGYYYQYFTSEPYHLYEAVMLAEPVYPGDGNCGDLLSWGCMTIDSRDDPDPVGFASHISLDLTWQDYPQLAYYDPAGKDLVMAYFNGSSWQTTVIDSGDAADVGRYVSLHAPKDPTDVTQAAYFDATNQTVKYAKYVYTSGNCTDPKFQCDAIENVGIYPNVNMGLSLAMDEQMKPILAYKYTPVSLLYSSLRIARPASVYGLAEANCGPGNTWQCLGVDPGDAQVFKADWAAVDVRPNGLASVAYTEYNNNISIGRLKIAQQYLRTFIPLLKR